MSPDLDKRTHVTALVNWVLFSEIDLCVNLASRKDLS